MSFLNDIDWNEFTQKDVDIIFGFLSEICFTHAKMHWSNRHFVTALKIDDTKLKLQYLIKAANNLRKMRVLLKLYHTIMDTHSWWVKWLGATQCLICKLSTHQIAQDLIKRMTLPNMVATYTAIELGYNCKKHKQLLPCIGGTIMELATKASKVDGPCVYILLHLRKKQT